MNEQPKVVGAGISVNTVLKEWSGFWFLLYIPWEGSVPMMSYNSCNRSGASQTDSYTTRHVSF